MHSFATSGVLRGAFVRSSFRMFGAVTIRIFMLSFNLAIVVLQQICPYLVSFLTRKFCSWRILLASYSLADIPTCWLPNLDVSLVDLVNFECSLWFMFCGFDFSSPWYLLHRTIVWDSQLSATAQMRWCSFLEEYIIHLLCQPSSQSLISSD